MNMIRKFSTVLTAVLISVCAMAQNIRISVDQLPDSALKLIDVAFPGDSIKNVRIEKRASLVQYEVHLAGKVKMQFSKDGKFTQCECSGKKPVPDILIPRKIREYLDREFKDRNVINLEHDSRLWEVILDNRVELDFNENCRLVDIDYDDD